MDSNVTSFDYRRKSLGELQRQTEQLILEIKRIQEKLDWQDMYIETLEVAFTKFQEEHDFMVNSILEGLRNLQAAVFKLNNKETPDDITTN